MTDLKPGAVFDVAIVNGRPVRTLRSANPDSALKAAPCADLDLSPSDELQQESARLNRMFASGNF